VAGDIGLQQVHQVEQGLAEEAIGRLLLDFGAVNDDAVFGLVYSDLIVLKAEVSIRHPTNKHHIIDAVPICLRGYYKSIATQSQKLTRLYNQKPDEVVQRYLSTATAIHQQAQCVKQEAMSELTMES
jgi:hypothetical protein